MMKNQFLAVYTSFFILYGSAVVAQTTFERLGQKAMMSGQFITAASYFEKAYASDNSNMNALWLMGYSNYHANDYKKCIVAFDKLLAMKPIETGAYYYRGKAKVLLAESIKDFTSIEKDKLLLSAIKDFSTSLELNPADMKVYQNRGLAYQEYGIYKSQKIAGVFNKIAAINALKLSIIDFQKVLEDNESRRDITSQIEKSKQILKDIKLTKA
jgi:tetratricopeptide (TPR) repeat protein